MSRSNPSRIPQSRRKKGKAGRKVNGRNNLEPEVQTGGDVDLPLYGFILDMLRDDAIVLEPRSQFNKCITGVTPDGVLVYCANDIVQTFVDQGMSDEDAMEFFHYNTLRALEYVPQEGRPIVYFER